MQARFVMERQWLTAHPEETGWAAAWRLAMHPGAVLLVTDEAGALLGALTGPAEKVRGAASVAEAMVPRERVPVVDPAAPVEALQALWERHPDWPCLPVTEQGRPVGVVHRTAVMAAAPSPAEDFDLAAIWAALPELMSTGLMAVDGSGVLRYLNRYGADLLGVQGEDVVGRPYSEVASVIFPDMFTYLAHSAIPRVLAGQEADSGEREVTLANGRQCLFKFAVLRRQARVSGIVVTFMDVSAIRLAEAQALAYAAEVEQAFGLTLPNSKVESKLKSSPEYQDVYDPASGRAVVTAVIADGTYRHVVNGLRLLAELHALGVFQLVGLDKDTLVTAFIFHDIGKEQPILRKGEEFIPEKTFEPGYLHAARSADWASKYYRVGEDVDWLIRTHHTPEASLPPDFPRALLPMYRILRLVDGLSAGITRRGAQVAPLKFDGSRLTVREDNPDSRYRRAFRLHIYSGQTDDLGFA